MSNKVGYKETKVGLIPEQWEVKPLKELCDLLNGRAYKKDELLSEGKTPILRVGNFFTNQQWYYSDLELEESKYCDNGDLLYAWSASFGPKIWDGSKVIYHYHIWKLRLAENIDKKFLYYSLLADVNKLKRSLTGSTMVHISKENMEPRLFPVPSLKEQQKIAEILSSVDAAIEKTEQVIAKTEEVKKGLMQQLLTKGIGHTEFKQTEIGEIPVEWEVKKLVNFSKINSENLTSSTQPEYEFNYIDIATITDTGIIGETTKYSFCDAPSRARRVVRNKDIIVSTVRPYLKSFAFITEEQDGYIASTGFAIIRVNEDVDSNYIYQHILSERFIEYCKSKMTGSNYPAISANDVKEYSIGIPPLKEQKKISSILNEYDKKLQCEKDKIIKLKSIKQGLMQQLLTGQARVKVD